MANKPTFTSSSGNKEIEAVTPVAGATPAVSATVESPIEVNPIDPRDAEIARLKAELEAERSKFAATAAVLSATGKFLVSVTDGPSWVVEAADSVHAFEIYKRAVGMISTPHIPSVVPIGSEHEVGKYKG